ncbi:transcription elongation factor A protein 3 [Amia ocellicauda]|uniref:transcription elongation factor A protein 3 n=1 Tax=Amia ocellicauda TaxID=2972642 RepID=UPI003463F3D2
MTREEDLIRIAKRLDKMVSRKCMDGALDLLKELKNYNMTLKLLQATRIGMSVNGVRKHCTDEEVIGLAKILIKNWKRLLESSGSQKGEGPSERDREMAPSKPVSVGGASQPAKPLADKEARRPSLDSKPSAGSPKKHTSDHKRERKDSKESKPPSPPPKRPPTEVKKDRKDAVDSKPFSPKRPSLEIKRDRSGKGICFPPHVWWLSNPVLDWLQNCLVSHSSQNVLQLETDTLSRNQTFSPVSRRDPKTDSKPLTPKRPFPDAKKERKDSTDSRSPPAKQPTLDGKRDRKDSTDSRSLPAKRPTLDGKRDRKDSESKPLPPMKRPSTDAKSNRRESSDSKTDSSPPPPPPKKRDSDAMSNSSPPPKKLSIDIKGERRDSLSSKSSQLSPVHRKGSTDSRDERVNSNKGKAETPKTPTSPTSPMSPSFSPGGGPLPPHLLTGDSVRDKCVEMLSAALRTDEDFKVFGTNCDSMAAEIEDHIYQEIKATDMKYKNRVRSRISNLKDPKNPELRRNVLRGAIDLRRIASMSAEEMASAELKQLRNVLTQEAIREHQMAKTGGTTTDLLQCGKCRKKNCTYNQVQTRSADEPMTTFVLCNECGNRWKFC